MNRIVTISFTPLDAPGGVPKFNRDLHAAFSDRECVHFSWWDFPWSIEMEYLPEWEKARTLNHYLVQSRKLLPMDTVIADGFWADGLQHMPNVVSHSHGIWSHLTIDDVKAGKAPENPHHNAAQVAFRRYWIEQGKHITAVSGFIAEQMKMQWGFEVERVINNGVDTDTWVPRRYTLERKRPLIVHGVNDIVNVNKGWDHIQLLKESLDADVLSLDEAADFVKGSKCFAMQQADVVAHPSGYEGNSMFVAEALASGVPVVGYNVGFLWNVPQDEVGYILDRNKRSPELFRAAVEQHISPDYADAQAEKRKSARAIAVNELSIGLFNENWRRYVEEIER